jgi:uncharacterized iron-regulated protein
MARVLHAAGTWIDPTSGNPLRYQDLLAGLASKQAVLLGETHDRADIHRWQLHVIAGLLAVRQDIVVGFEMFPRRVQPVLDEWVFGDLTGSAFLEKVEWTGIWGFPAELYLPIFQFCRQFKLPMKALNCRRSLVTEVGKLGWDAIAVEDRDNLTPAKTASDAHRHYLFAITGGARPDRRAASGLDPQFDRFVRAQQTWDRAFACNIAEARSVETAPLVVGIIGSGHLEYRYGTPYQLADLGLDDVAVLLTRDLAELDTGAQADIADAVFRLEKPDL